VQVKCDTSLKRFQQELQHCFRPHPDWRSKQIVIVPQSCGGSNFGSFEPPPWDSRDKKQFGCRRRRKAQRILYGGRCWLPPNPGCGESCESEVACGLS
jgi:hypothetical protein